MHHKPTLRPWLLLALAAGTSVATSAQTTTTAETTAAPATTTPAAADAAKPADKPKPAQQTEAEKAPAAAKPAAAKAAGDEAISLAVFEVNTDKDDGFAAASAGMGGRLNMDMADIAAPYSAMTREFIDALGITNLVEAGSWSTNGAPTFDGQGVDMFGNPNLVNVRGVGASQNGQRNFSFTASILDSYNLERYEFGRGPNGALFNISSGSNDNPLIGGQSATTKRARLGRESTAVTYATGSWNYNRATLDSNIPIGKQIAVRANAVWYDRDGWRFKEFEKTKGVTLAGTYLISRNAELRVEASTEDLSRSQPMTLIYDKLSGWDGSTVFNAPISDAVRTGAAVNPATSRALTANGANQGVDRRTGFNAIYVPGLNAIYNFQNEGLTLRGDENANVPFYTGGVAVYRGSGLPFGNGGNNNGSPTMTTNPGDTIWFLGQDNLPSDRFDRAIAGSAFRIPSRRYTMMPDFPVFQQNTKDANLAFTYQVAENLVVEIGGDINRSDDQRMQNANQSAPTRIDINQLLPDGTTNPNYLQPYGEMFGRLAKRTTDVAMGRFNIGYYKDFGAWGAYQVTLAGLINQIDVADENRLLTYALGTDRRAWPSMVVGYRYYWNNPLRPYNSPEDLPSVMQANIFNTNSTIASRQNLAISPGWVLNDWSDVTRKNSSLSAGLKANYKLFGRRLVFLAMPRFDAYENSLKQSKALADLPSDWDGMTKIYRPTAPSDWLNLTYIPRNTTTGAALTTQPALAVTRPRSNVAAYTISNTAFNLSTPIAVYANDRFRDDFSAPDVSGNRLTGSYGFVYHVMPWLSVPFNYATNYGIPPVNTFTIYNEAVAARQGTGWDTGLRFNLLKSRLTVNLGYYSNHADKARVTSPIVGNANTLLQQQSATDSYTSGRNQRGIVDFFTNDYQTQDNEGFEIEVTGRITKGWRVTLNGGSSKITSSDFYPLSRQWIFDYDPILQDVLRDAGGMLTGGTQATGAPGLAVANPAITPASATDRNNAVSAYNNMWANYQNAVLTTTRSNVVTYYKANIFSDYTIQTGALKGLRIGLGAQFRGGDRANVAGTRVGQSIVNSSGVVVDDPEVDSFSNVYVYQPTNTVATLGYKTRIKKRDVDFQLNIRNLINEDAIIYQDSGVTLRPPDGNIAVPNRVAVASRVADYQQPMSFIFTTKVTF